MEQTTQASSTGGKICGNIIIWVILGLIGYGIYFCTSWAIDIRDRWILEWKINCIDRGGSVIEHYAGAPDCMSPSKFNLKG